MTSIHVVVMDGKVVQVTTVSPGGFHTFIDPSPASVGRLRSLLRGDAMPCFVRHTHRDEGWLERWRVDERRRKELGLSNTNKVSPC